MKTTDTSVSLARGLRRTGATHDAHIRAAVELLIQHDRWLRRKDFVDACVHIDSAATWINWRQARQLFNEGLVGSTTELAVLDYAITLAENRFKFTQMDDANRRLIVDATAQALGVWR